LYLSPLPILSALLVMVCWRGMRTGRASASFYSAVAVFVFAFVGLAISSYPYLVPWHVTLWDAAADPAAQKFIFIGIAILLPFILGYTIFSYYTFRGRLREGEGYH
jgi:cytochrome d ubiquinol oxidase subunit II